MIETLSIERFKSIRSLTIQCSKVNVLIGPPDTGKTNVLEALYLVSRLGWGCPLDSSLRMRPELGFDPLFYRQFFESPIRITCLRGPDPKINLEITIHSRDRKIELRTARGDIVASFGSVINVPEYAVVRFYTYTQSEHWQYTSDYPRGTESVNPPHGYNLLYIARHNSRVYEFLKETTGPAWKLRFDQAQKTFRLSEIREDEILDYNLDLLSDSLKRFFFYGSILMTSQDAVLVFDEPDVYAFPPYPKRLGEMIAADESNQFFVTTHNPYFLSSLVEKTPSERLGVFVASKDGDGATALTRLTAPQLSDVIEQGASVFFNLDAFAAS